VLVPINESGEAAANGTAAHELLQDLPIRGFIDFGAVDTVAKKHGADTNEVRMLCAMATKIWPEIAASFEGASTEVEIIIGLTESVELSGHIDAVLIAGNVARALDWKTGHKDSDYSEQLKAYGMLLFHKHPELTEVTVTAVWVRTAHVETYTMKRKGAVAWIEMVLNTVVKWDGVYRPSETNCAHCKRSHECAAANALVRRDVAAFTDQQLVAAAESQLATMQPDEIVSLLQKAKLVSKYAERVSQAIKSHVLRNGDIVGNETRLTIEIQNKRELDVVKTWPILEESGFTDKDFAEVIDISVSRLEAHVAKRAGRGNGASAKRDLQAKLDAAGAIQTKEIQKLEQRRTGT
jgi:hypothetical protein